MKMKFILSGIGALVLFAALPALAAQAQTFTGYISDDMCGLDHSMMEKKGESDKTCVIACVKEGSKYVLADTADKQVYQLDDQKKPAEFAGEKVKVEGTLRGKTIHVETITRAQ